MIDRILDKYYSNKLKHRIDFILSFYNIDYKFESDKTFVNVEIKARQYSKLYYERIYTWRIDNSLENLIDIDNVIKTISNNVNEYIAYNKIEKRWINE